jgi:hypothetical protein
MKNRNLVKGLALSECYWPLPATSIGRQSIQLHLGLAKAHRNTERRRYAGVWALGSKLLLALGVAVCAVYISFSHRNLYHGVMDADRGVELSIFAVIVGVSHFLRYYGLAAKSPDRQLALGFAPVFQFFRD